MPEIRNTTDLLLLLQEDPEFLEATRRLILTDDLLQAPEAIRELKKDVGQLNQRMGRVEDKVDQLDQRMGRVEDKVDQLDQRMGRVEDKVDQLDQKVDQLDRRVGNLEEVTQDIQRTVKRLEVSVGEMKGNIGRYAVENKMFAIAGNFNLEVRNWLRQRELIEIVPKPGKINLELNEWQSFLRADCVIQGEDPREQTHYIVIEASYTADERDSYRAVRNARIIREQTGNPAYPLVAGVHQDHHIRELVGKGEIFWFQLEPEDFNPE